MGLYGNTRKRKKWTLPEVNLGERYHSGFYHRVFEGYTEVRKLQPDGKQRIERIYTGKYYHQKLCTAQRILLRILYLVLVLCTVAAFWNGIFSNAASNSLKSLAVVDCVVILAFVKLAMATVNYLTAPVQMKAYEYRSSSESLRSCTLVIVVALFVLLLGKLIYLCYQGSVSLEEVYSMFCIVMGIFSSGSITMLERKVPYQVTENELAHKIDGVEISIKD
ncbi:MAG: hypothetical protein LUG45_05030 [Clostridiales bacterium]|nr:hypothetical protein [Clostridiales bacterium]